MILCLKLEELLIKLEGLNPKDLSSLFFSGLSYIRLHERSDLGEHIWSCIDEGILKKTHSDE